MPVDFFSPPNGDEITNPDLGWLRDRVLTGGPDFWNAGAGQGWLVCRQRGKGRTELLLTFDPALGFCLEYVDPDHTYFVSLGDGDFERTVRVFIGGDPVVLPSAFFLPPDVAWRAVADFCRTGERSAAVRWGNRSELNWHDGFPEGAWAKGRT